MTQRAFNGFSTSIRDRGHATPRIGRILMPNVPTHIARLLFDDAGPRRTNPANRGRFGAQPRRRSPRARNERH